MEPPKVEWPREIAYKNGIPLELDYHSEALVDRIMDLEYRKDDIIVATYPKAGTTMTQEIVWLVMNNGDTEAAGKDFVYSRVPFLEFNVPRPSNTHGDCRIPIEHFLRQTSPRMAKTHLPWKLGPQQMADSGAKIIYVMRNPKDTCVSNYYFAQAFKNYPYRGPFADFMRIYFGPDMVYGTIFDHFLGFWQEKQRDNILFVYYEDLVHDHRAQVVKIATFLDQSLSDEVIDKIVTATTFKTMKDNPMTNYTHRKDDSPDAPPFMRKGKTGDWENHFSAEDAAIVDQMIADRLRPVGIKY